MFSNDINRPWLWCLAVLLPFLAFACFHDDDDDTGTTFGDSPPIVLSSYAYTIADTTGGANPLTISLTENGTDIQAQILLGNSLNGSFNTITDEFTLDALSSFIVNTDLLNPFLGSVDVSVTQTIVIPFDSSPISGEWQILFPPINPTEVITVTVVPNGVDLSLDGGALMFFTWDQFEDLIDDAMAPDWQRRASLSGLTAQFVLEQADLVLDALDLIDDPLTITNPLILSCDAFPGMPPSGVLSQGTSEFSWTGTGSDILQGDDFSWTFDDCWFDDLTDTFDDLINGSVDLVNYNEVIDGNNRLVRIGFEPFGQQPGGVFFNNLIGDETEENPPGVFTIDPSERVTLNGEFTIVFFEP